MSAVLADAPVKVGRSRYLPPEQIQTTSLNEALRMSGRFSESERGQTMDLFQPQKIHGERQTDLRLYAAGDLALLKCRSVSIIGTRSVSAEGERRAKKLAAALVSNDVVILSGLAMGVDTAAQVAAIGYGGRTIAVVGTPLDKCNPLRNSKLQELIYREHLLLSQFAWGSPVYPANFPQRNKVMAALSDATVIIEASDTSGTLHQAVECVRLKRPLFITQAVVDDPALKWPKEFLKYENVRPLRSVDDVLATLKGGESQACH